MLRLRHRSLWQTARGEHTGRRNSCRSHHLVGVRGTAARTLVGSIGVALPADALRMRSLARELSDVPGARTAGGTRGPGSACVAHTTWAGGLWLSQGADRACDLAIGHVELGKQVLQLMGTKRRWQIVSDLDSQCV